MTIILSDRTRAILNETLPLIEQHRASLQQALERYVAREAADDPSASTTAAAAILDMLLRHARQLGGNGLAARTAETAAWHRALGLGGGLYSRFGDGLRPIMRDVLGRKATPPVLAAWIDAYWAIVRSLFRQETRLAA